MTMTVNRRFVIMVLAAVMWTAWSAVVPREARSVRPSRGRSLVKREYPYPAYPYTTKPPVVTHDPGSCFYDGKYYMNGEYIEQAPCYFLLCLDGGVAVADKSCETPDGCNINLPPDDCCPLCQIATTPSPPVPTTETPGCVVAGIFYPYGEYISKEPCFYEICTQEGIVYGDIFCDTPSESCNQHNAPNECCPACQVNITTTTTKVPKPAECSFYGSSYGEGEHIDMGPCSYLVCSKSKLLYYDVHCDNTVDYCNVHTPPSECCPRCPHIDSETTTPKHY